jgi:drug/metabolite transporter (DMT)-like permease
VIGELLALASAVCWSASSLVLKHYSGRVSTLVLNAYRLTVATAIHWLIALPFVRLGDLAKVDATGMACLVGAALLGIGIGDTLYIRALRFVPVSVAFPIVMSGYAVFTFALSAAFLGERITLQIGGGAALVVAGITLVMLSATGDRAPKGAVGKPWMGVLLSLAVALLWGAGVSLLKRGMQDIDAMLANCLRLPLVALMVGGLARLRTGSFQLPRVGRRGLVLLAVSGVLGYSLGGVIFLIAIVKAGASKTAILTSLSPIFTAAFSRWLLKEPLTLRLVFGTLLSVGGVCLIVA